MRASRLCAFGFVISLGYVLSYPLTFLTSYSDDTRKSFYAPVEYLIDTKSLHGEMLRWCAINGVESKYSDLIVSRFLEVAEIPGVGDK